ncbi:MAG TPA: UDP-N-acetylglucosamine 1-carboxyvinyltransferase [Fibrobacteres bacterium]|jgi:UDP-N-acetylglucosamine 1-carboxyvinyltransferase|nr:UDP-N-acetylglucosamine 1-carboxyvinyltransferase [Fibrobacterota bacterium]
MSGFFVEGNHRLKGSICTAGNKNEALPLIAASLLCDKPVELSNVPDIGDVQTMLEIAGRLGAVVSGIKNNKCTIKAKTISTSALPLELSNKIRGSILFASALLIRTGRAEIPQPGGDSIGRRPIDTHFLVFKALGAKFRVQRKIAGSNNGIVKYILEADNGLKGTDIYLDEASVTATENALIAAAGARGITTIINAASEPHVQGLCEFLVKMGVVIEGIGSNVLTVHGALHFKPARHEIGCDYIEAGSFIGLAASTHSDITITNVDIKIMRMILFQFEHIGVCVETDLKNQCLHVPSKQKMKIKKDMGGAIPKIEDNPWPGFPADLMSIILVTATQSAGTCLLHEKMFDARLFFVDKLIGMGAQIVLCDPHRAVIVGPSRLYGGAISSPDIRAGMALLIAALAAKGKSVINNIAQIDRGYQKIDERLNALGAHITRIAERRNGACGV